MLKPNNYDQTQAGGSYEAPEVGGHHMVIKAVKETMSKGNPDKGTAPQPMIVVYFDFAPNDRQPGLLMQQFKDDIRPDKKWPHSGTAYIMVTGSDGKTSRNYKTFCTCFERSNNTTINWTEDPTAWAAQFKDRKIGGAFGIVHGEYKHKETVRTELRWFLSDDKVDPANIPAEKQLTDAEKARITGANTVAGFMDIPDGIDDEGLPFN